ncbi:DUF805 domain-containing protein [Thalassotalea fonticola]|uniref:DUF805 domain-containing protein n=1 Tax=Thalassotalea fonticola TaxID=3065649 RepID=A0ABZ0GNU7_9GAMM|nr:DUF805 domain-containing protein [Colwelliaceae bacterium S1-1]
MTYYVLALQNYANFKGTTSRKAFWTFYLTNHFILFLVGFIEGYTGKALFSIYIYVAFILGITIPMFSITTRRLHDIGRSGWWQLIALIPILGYLILWFLCSLKSKATPETLMIDVTDWKTECLR